MRLHIELDEGLVARLDAVAGARGRSRFVRQAIEQALDQEERWRLLAGAAGSIPDEGHEWDEDAAAWVRAQRLADGRRVG